MHMELNLVNYSFTYLIIYSLQKLFLTRIASQMQIAIPHLEAHHPNI